MQDLIALKDAFADAPFAGKPAAVRAVNPDLVLLHTVQTHCALGPYWAARLGKDEIVGYQASARGGTGRVRLRADRVDLLGRGVTIMRGTLAV
jgi:predicted PhzF superfamily epimerase YddE/YHI9